MSRFDIGDKLECIDPVGYLKAGVIYTCDTYTEDEIDPTDDIMTVYGVTGGYYPSRFKLYLAVKLDLEKLGQW